MIDCNTVSAQTQSLDPFKRVNYTFGMVLGEDDFRQDQGRHDGLRRLHLSALHGYGTVWGLQVVRAGDVANPVLRVEPGMAINPQGQEICVPTAQCAELNTWLDRHRIEGQSRFGSPPGRHTLHVVLCHSECETDFVPIPGGPCRSQEETVAPSRILDHFKIALKWDSPLQLEEDIVRRFGELLCRLELGSTSDSGMTPAQMAGHVRALADFTSPPLSPPEDLRVAPSALEGVLREAFRVWVTEVRPKVRGMDQGKPCSTPDEHCLLLARLEFDVIEVGGKLQVQGPLHIDEQQRPMLLHTRLLQEWLLCHRGIGTACCDCQTFATLFLLDPTTVRIWIHYPQLVQLPAGAITVILDEGLTGSPPTLANVSQPVPGVNVFDLHLDRELANGQRLELRFDASRIAVETSPVSTLAVALAERPICYTDRAGDEFVAYVGVQRLALNDLADVDVTGASDNHVLTRQGGQWIAAPQQAGITDHGNLDGLADDDHPQYLRVDGSRALGNNLSAGGNSITNLRAAAANGEAVPFEQAIKDGDPAGGDLILTYPDPRVRALQGRPVRDANPVNGQVLAWDGSAWRPAAPPAPAGEFVTRLPGVRSYAIVAAGRVGPRPGQEFGPVYGGLRVENVQDGNVFFTFDGIELPSPNTRFNYIVKALPVVPNFLAAGNLRFLPTLAFGGFLDSGDFLLLVGGPRGPLSMSTIFESQVEFMIEVSRYEL